MISESSPLVRKALYQQQKEEYGKPTLTPTLILTIIVVTFGSSLQFGYGTGVMSNSKDFIMESFHQQGKEYNLTQWSVTVSSFCIGGLIGALFGTKILGKYFGRRMILMINNVFLVASSLFMCLAPVWWYQALGRVFHGIVAGIATAVVPTYFSEISPIQIRGAIGTLHQLGTVTGILLSQALSTPRLHLFGSKENWPWLFVVPVVCGMLEVFLLPWCPESPTYLYQTEGKNAARKALSRLLTSEDEVGIYLKNIQREMEHNFDFSDAMESNEEADYYNDDDNNNMTIMELIRDEKLRKQLIVGVTVQLMMQLSGINAVLYYSTTIFQHASVKDPEMATTYLGIVNFLVTIIAVRYVESFGRKTLLIYSWVGMCISFALLSCSFILKEYANVPKMELLSVVSTVGIVIFFAFGPGCISWFLITEIFSMPARDSAMAIGTFANWLANWLVAFGFPALMVATKPFTFLVFVATTGFFLYFTTFYIPETKGKTVPQVTKSFERLPIITA